MTMVVRRLDRKFGDRLIENLQRLLHKELTQNLESVFRQLETIETHVDSEGRPIWRAKEEEEQPEPFTSYRDFLKAERGRGLSISPMTLRLMQLLSDSLEDSRSRDPEVQRRLHIQELTDEHLRCLLDVEGNQDLNPLQHAELVRHLRSHRELVFRSYLSSCAQYAHLFSAEAISRALSELLEISPREEL